MESDGEGETLGRPLLRDLRSRMTPLDVGVQTGPRRICGGGK
jgi:hypothetical protein